MEKNTNVRQRDISDCGAACLTSISAYYDHRLSVARVRQLASTDEKGTTVFGMIEAATKIGFECKGVKGTFNSLFKIPIPAIAHVIVKDVLHHFVVIYTITPDHIEIMDPAMGEHVLLSHDQFRKIWTGVLVLLLPGETFVKADQEESRLSRFQKLITPHRGVLTQAVFGALVYALVGLSIPIYIRKIVDDVLVDGNLSLLDMMSCLMIGLIIVSVLIGFTKGLFTLKTGQLIDTHLILGYQKHLLELPMQFFDSMKTGEIISRVSDAIKIRTFINDGLINIVVNCFVVVFSFIVMYTYHWKLAVVMLFILPLYFIVQFVTSKLNQRNERTLIENTAALESGLVESINSILTIKSFGLEAYSKLKSETRFYNLLQSVYSSGLNSLFSNSSIEFISRLFTVLLLWIGARYVLENQITPGELLSFYALISYFTGPLNGLMNANKIIRNAMIAADRLFEITELKQEESANKVRMDRGNIGSIKFENVSFKYGSRVSVFEDLSLLIPAGAVVAIVGESGSGKSTLTHILQKLYPIKMGTIYIGDFDLKDIDSKSLHQHIAVVHQKLDLFAGSIIDNIAIGEKSPDIEKIISICTSLGMLEFIEKLPAGFNTYLGENGAILSGGQKQRIGIARAVYRDPEILILDEATSSLDMTSEKYVQRMVRTMKDQKKTVIVIAHRLSTVISADKIIVIENGKVAEEGSHDELIHNKRQYYQLWKNQFPREEKIEHD